MVLTVITAASILPLLSGFFIPLPKVDRLIFYKAAGTWHVLLQFILRLNFLFMKHILILPCIAISFCLFSCGDDSPEKDATGSLSIEFDNVVGEDDLTLNAA